MTIVKVGLTNLKIEMFIGILEEEVECKQNVFIDVECLLSSLNFKIEKTFDYRIIEVVCTQLAKNKKYDLLENYAKDILKELKKHEIIKRIKLKINKPNAIKQAESAYLEIEELI